MWEQERQAQYVIMFILFLYFISLFLLFWVLIIYLIAHSKSFNLVGCQAGEVGDVGGGNALGLHPSGKF